MMPRAINSTAAVKITNKSVVIMKNSAVKNLPTTTNTFAIIGTKKFKAPKLYYMKLSHEVCFFNSTGSGFFMRIANLR